MLAGVPARTHDPDAGTNCLVAIEEVDDAGRLEWDEVVLQVAGAVALVRMRGVFPFGRADQAAGVRKARPQSSVLTNGGAAKVIPMKMTRQRQINRLAR